MRNLCAGEQCFIYYFCTFVSKDPNGSSRVLYEGKNYQIWNTSLPPRAMAHHGHGPLPGSDNVFASTTPTQPPFLSRTRSSTWSTVDNPPHHNQGTSYYSQASISPTAQF